MVSDLDAAHHPSSRSDHLFEHTVFAAPVFKSGVCRPRTPAIGVGIGRPDLNEPIRIGIWKGPQQDGIYHTEHGRVCSNPQGQGQHRYCREYWVTPHHPRCVLHIAAKRFEQMAGAYLADSLLDLLDSAELKARLSPGLLLAHARSHAFVHE